MCTVKKIASRVIAILTMFFVGFVVLGGNVKAESRNRLLTKVSRLTSSTIEQVYYADYDGNGSKEAFVVTSGSGEANELYFTCDDYATEITAEDLDLPTDEMRIFKFEGAKHVICDIRNKKKMFVIEAGFGGSASSSICLLVEDNKVYKVELPCCGLQQMSGKEFTIHPKSYDATGEVGKKEMMCGGTFKAYYVRWTGTQFVEYKGKAISKAHFKKFKLGKKYLSKIKKMGYKIGKIYYRTNGIVNVNVSKTKSGWVNYDNVTFKVKGKKLKLVIHNKNGKNIVEKSTYGGIYAASSGVF